MKKRLLSLLLIGCFVITAVAGCGDKTEESETNEATEIEETEEQSTVQTDIFNQAEHLNVALQPIPGYLPITVLQDKGWLQEALAEAGYEDIRLDFTEFESGPPEREAVTAGSQDIGVMGNVPTISGIGDGEHLYILGVAYNGPETEAVIVPNGSGIQSVSDLRGKTVGLVKGSIAQDYFSRLLEKEGVDIAEMSLEDIGLSAQLEALSTGKVDAIVTWQPIVARAQYENIGRILVDGTGVYKCENLVFGNMEYVELNPEIVQIFFEQYARAAKEVTNNRQYYAEEYADKYGLEPEVLESVLETINYQVSIGDGDIADFQKTANWLLDSGTISEELDVTPFVYDTFANSESVAIYLQ